MCAMLMITAPMLNFMKTNPLLSSQISMVFCMFLFMPAIVTGLVIARSIKLPAGAMPARFACAGVQVGFAFGVAVLIAVTAITAITQIGGAKLSFGGAFIFAVLGVFAVQTIVLCAVDWFGMRGIIIPALIMIFGMPVMQLPKVALPWFWRNMIYPWCPQKFIAEGFRAMVTHTGGVGAQVAGLVAILCFVLSIMIARCIILSRGRGEMAYAQH